MKVLRVAKPPTSSQEQWTWKWNCQHHCVLVILIDKRCWAPTLTNSTTQWNVETEMTKTVSAVADITTLMCWEMVEVSFYENWKSFVLFAHDHSVAANLKCQNILCAWLTIQPKNFEVSHFHVSTLEMICKHSTLFNLSHCGCSHTPPSSSYLTCLLKYDSDRAHTYISVLYFFFILFLHNEDDDDVGDGGGKWDKQCALHHFNISLC